MPRVIHPLGEDPRVVDLLQFAMWRLPVKGVGVKNQEEVRRPVHRFLLAMMGFAELPPRKFRWPPDYRDRYWRRFMTAAAAISPLSEIAGANLLRHKKLAYLASHQQAGASFLLNGILRKSNKPSVGFCRSCGEFWIRETASGIEVVGPGSLISVRRSPTHSGACYNQLYEREHRKSGDDAERKGRARAAAAQRSMARSKALIAEYPGLKPGEPEMLGRLLEAGRIEPGDVPGILERMAGQGKSGTSAPTKVRSIFG